MEVVPWCRDVYKRQGEFLQVGYFAQEDTPSNSETALDYIWNEYPAMTNAEVRACLLYTSRCV